MSLPSMSPRLSDQERFELEIEQAGSRNHLNPLFHYAVDGPLSGDAVLVHDGNETLPISPPSGDASG